MHDTAHEHGRLFFELYGYESLRTVIELGSLDVNGSLREHCPPGVHYIGLDVMPAKGVDLVVNPDAFLPLASDTADAVVTSSAFEHDVCFWDTFLELTRILKPGGLLYLNAPSNGDFHRYPLDCWRFYPDAGVALTKWAARRGIQIELVESFIGLPQAERWADFVAVFRKAGGAPLNRKGRIADHAPAVNVHDIGTPEEAPLGAESPLMPDMLIADELRARLAAADRESAARYADLDDARQRNDILFAELATISAEVDTTRQRNDALASDVAAIQAEATALRQSLITAEQRLAEARLELAALHDSTSWRLTAGLRRMAIFLRGR